MTSRAMCTTRRGEPLEVLALRRAQHERMPSSSTYRALRTAADALDAWPLEQDAARATLQRADPRGFVDALLGDGELELAWSAAERRLRRTRSAPTCGCGSPSAASRDRPGRRARGLPADRRRGARASRSARVPLGRADPPARTSGGAGRRRGRRVRRVPHAPARAIPATADADRDPRQGQPPLKPSRRPASWYSPTAGRRATVRLCRLQRVFLAQSRVLGAIARARRPTSSARCPLGVRSTPLRREPLTRSSASRPQSRRPIAPPTA